MNPASVGPGGVPLPGELIDPLYHVNLAWHARDMDAAFMASQAAPVTPSRAWDLPGEVEPGPSPVPTNIPAWKGKAALREAGLLDTVEAAALAAGARVVDAWAGASEWSRDSDFMLSLAAGLELKKQHIDDMFRAADAMRG